MALAWSAHASCSVTLAWDASPDTTVVGYRVHYGGASQAYTNNLDVGSVTSARVSGLVDGATYFFAVTAYNTDGLESDFSNEISYTTPPPPSLQISLGLEGFVSLAVTGRAGRTYDILATENLVDWTALGTVAVGQDGPVEFLDTNSTTYSRRYYRLRQSQ